MKIYNRTLYDKFLIIQYNKYFFTNFLLTRYSFMGAIVLGFSVYMFILNQTSYALTLIGILIAYFILIYLMQIYSTKRNIKNNPIVANPFVQEYLFTDDEIIMSYGEKTTYEIIKKVRVTKQFIVIQSKDQKTYLVSLTGFKTEEDKNNLIQFLKEHFKRRKAQKTAK